MPISDYVTVAITATTAFPTRAGFGTALILGYHTAYPDLIRRYTDLSQVSADGILSTGVGSSTYWAAAMAFSQNPRPTEVKIGRRVNAWTQVVKYFPQSTVNGVVYTSTIGPMGGSALKWTYTVSASPSLATICTNIKAAIDALGLGVTVAITDTNTAVQVTSNVAGAAFVHTARNKDLELLNTTAAPAGITADIDNIRALDDNWYGLALDSNSKAEVEIVQPYVEPITKVFFADSGDTEDGKVGVSGTLLKFGKAAGYNRSPVYMNSAAMPSFLGIGAFAAGSTYSPDVQVYNYKGKKINSATVDALSATAAGEIKAQNGNTYLTTAGLSMTQEGVAPSGQFIDLQVGLDCLSARIQEAILTVYAANLVIPYTDDGVNLFVSAVSAVLERFRKSNFLASSPAPRVTAPLVATVDQATRAARIFPALNFSANFAGAINKVGVIGTVQP